MITAKSLEEVRKQLKNATTPKYVLAHDEKFNRAVLEQIKPGFLVMNHARQKSDTLRSLDLPLNDVAARIAAKNGVAICFDLQVLRILPLETKARELARIANTISICRKTQTKLALLNASTPESAAAFLRSLGASTEQASQALAF
jgi:RNase P/RNase MRP subunit p30